MAKIIYASFGEDIIFTGEIFPESQFIGTGEIKNYRIMFKGESPLSYATIEPEENFYVPVTLWEIPADESKISLVEDKIIHHLPGNTRRKFEVEVETAKGEIIKAITFVLSDELPLEVPDTRYHAAIWECYEKFGFDTKLLKDAEQFSDRRRFFDDW